MAVPESVQLLHDVIYDVITISSSTARLQGVCSADTVAIMLSDIVMLCYRLVDYVIRNVTSELVSDIGILWNLVAKLASHTYACACASEDSTVSNAKVLPQGKPELVSEGVYEGTPVGIMDDTSTQLSNEPTPEPNSGAHNNIAATGLSDRTQPGTKSGAGDVDKDADTDAENDTDADAEMLAEGCADGDAGRSIPATIRDKYQAIVLLILVIVAVAILTAWSVASGSERRPDCNCDVSCVAGLNNRHETTLLYYYL